MLDKRKATPTINAMARITPDVMYIRAGSISSNSSVLLTGKVDPRIASSEIKNKNSIVLHHMSLMNAEQYLRSISHFPKDINLDLISKFLLYIPGPVPMTESTILKLNVYHNQTIDELIRLRVSLQEEVKRNEDLSDGDPPFNFDDQNIHIFDHIRRYRYVFKKINRMRKKLGQVIINVDQKNIVCIDNLFKSITWFEENPQPIIANLERLRARPIAQVFDDNIRISNKLRALKVYMNDLGHYINTYPPLFRLKLANKEFIRSMVDSGMANRRSSTSYFEPLTNEETLYMFFDSSASQLAANNLLPINVKDEDEISDWIMRAADIIAQIDDIQITERRSVIQIFLTRYIFFKLYPKFAFIEHENDQYMKTKLEFIKKTPIEANIPEQYIPNGCSELPLTSIFQSSSIASAPLQWFGSIAFHICPLDIAYSIFKVHESLSIMAALTASQNTNVSSSEDFFSHIPGFDDIFDLWVALLTSSPLFDPRGLSDHLGIFSNLPGFPQRFVVCLAYLEASISHIETLYDKNG